MAAASMTEEPVISTVLARSPASGRLAREFVASALSAPTDGRLEVVVTELVTNAVVHGMSALRLTVRLGDGVALVEVADSGAGRPELQPGPTVETHGRGLAIVDSFAEEWGVSADPDGLGKVVWARVSLGAA